MTLDFDWEPRINVILDMFPKVYAQEVGAFEFSGFTTFDQLTSEEALQREFRPMPKGTRWGKMWEYGWFKASVTIPDKAAGRRVMLNCRPGLECLVMVNGEPVSSLSSLHERLELTRDATPGKTFDILVEAYAGHGPQLVWLPPTLNGQEPWSYPTEPQCVIPRCVIEVWEDEAYALHFDLQTLVQLRDQIDASSLRHAEINAALCDVVVMVDFELPRNEMIATFSAAREQLKPLLKKRNGPTTPTFFCFGHGHLDIAWLWPFQESERKIARTLSNTLALAEQYPGYRFLQSQAHLFWILKNRYPDLYTRVKDAVKAGTIIPDGGMWVEPDTNITSGESLIRQFIHGKRFFREEFDFDSKVVWLPDVFGFTAALPQIVLGCGMNYFSTAKMSWGSKSAPFPYAEFMWEGIDGSRLLTHFCVNYNAMPNPERLITRWNERTQKSGYDTMLLPFGYGDGGGGPAREHLEFLTRCADLEGVPKTKFASPQEFFERLEERGCAPARYVGELYLSCHRGCQTTQARTKRGNRKSEIALHEAEFWGVIAGAVKGAPYPRERMECLWRKVLLNQFHDVLPGSSIKRVYEEAESSYQTVIKETGDIAQLACNTLTDDSPNSITVFNSLSWPRSVLVSVPENFRDGVETVGRLCCEVQDIEGVPHVEVDVPACGCAPLRKGGRLDTFKDVAATSDRLENDHLRVMLNERGEIISLWDKDADRELTAGPCNALSLFKDTPVNYDAWNLDRTYQDMPVPLDEPAEIEIVTSGPLVSILRVKRRIANSDLTQDIILQRGSRRVDFRTTIDWQERHKLLKVLFPVDIQADHAVHEIQFGHIQRPNHDSWPFDAQRYEVPQQKWTALMEAARGVAILNDCKYGVGVREKTIGLTLLRSPVAPDKTADQGRHEFTYALYAWNGSFMESDLLKEAYDLNVPVITVPGDKDDADASFFEVSPQTIVLETVKPAEDGSGDIILRLYEATRSATRCRLKSNLPVKSARITNMLEAGDEPVAIEDRAITLNFRPFEIKTIRLRLS